MHNLFDENRKKRSLKALTDVRLLKPPTLKSLHVTMYADLFKHLHQCGGGGIGSSYKIFIVDPSHTPKISQYFSRYYWNDLLKYHFLFSNRDHS